MKVREMLVLAPVFDAIYAEKNISRAAQRLGVTQSAVSQSLARLRLLAGDELFLSTGQGVQPTPRAAEMAPYIHTALTAINAGIALKQSDMQTLERTFVLDIGAGFDALVLSILYPEIAKHAPKARLLISNTRAADLGNALKFGETELAFDFAPLVGEGIRSELITSVPMMVVARRNHPALAGGLSREVYCRLSHVGLVWTRSADANSVAVELARQGIKINVVASVPTLMSVGTLVSSSDLLGTVGKLAAQELARTYEIEVHPMPFSMPPAEFYQMWHARYEKDAAHAWLRETIKRLGSQLTAESRGLVAALAPEPTD